MTIILQEEATRGWRKAAAVSLVVGLAAGAGCLISHRSDSLPGAYLYAYLFWLGVTLGSLAWVLVHNLTGGHWGEAIHPLAEAASLTLPLMVVLFVPIMLSMGRLYPWVGAEEQVWLHRRPYLNETFFLVRSAIYFVLWLAMTFLAAAWARRWSSAKDARAGARLRRFSAGGLVVYLLTITHAGYDWLMSRDADFYSTAFGFVVATGQALAAMAFLILVFVLLTRPGAAPRKSTQGKLFIDLGNLLLTIVILWTYVTFMQFLVIWMGNKRDDNAWFTQRGFSGGGEHSEWKTFALAMIALHFFVPFFVLLFRDFKRRANWLAGLCAPVLLGHLMEEYLLVFPSGMVGGGMPVDAAVFLAPVAIGGVWMAAFFFLLPRRTFLRGAAP